MCLGSSLQTQNGYTSSKIPCPSNLKITFWNIQGYKSRIVGEKLNDPDFISEVQKSDIIGLVETHIHEEILDKLSIPGFVLLKYKNRKKSIKNNKAFGGIAIFTKHSISKIVHYVETENQDTIWLKLNKIDTGLTNDIYIGTSYISPHKGKQVESEKINNLAKDIIRFKGKGGQIIIQGDLNARTSTEKDFIDSDKYNTDDEIELIKTTPRNSHDKVIDGRGKEVLELCKSLNLNIVNGRKVGDQFGNFTSFQWNGNSLIDYVISSQSLFHQILTFKVGEYKPWISDHCALHYILQTKTILNSIPEKCNLINTAKAWFWDTNSNEKFDTYLNSTEISERLTNISNINNPNTMAAEITKTLDIVASKCGIKRKQPSKNRQNNPPWYDNDCHSIKLKVKQTAKLVRRQPYQNNLKETLFALKKQLKNKIKENKRIHKENILNQLNCNIKDTKKFWKILEKIHPKHNDDNFKSGISGQRWVNYFKSIYTDTETQPFPPSPVENGPLDYIITMDELTKASYILKPGKAPGIDGISNEMILCLLSSNPLIILKLFNAVLLSDKPMECWNTSIINPIHKKGTKLDPENYRGISLLCCLGKYFSAILNIRLMNFTLENNILSNEQLGFVPGNRTSDPLLILYNLVNYYCAKNNKHIYACFVDFKKAFDSIPRHKLFEKLIKHNITGKFYDCLKHMYSKEITCVKVGNKLTDTFQTSQGVKQGCILSPLLFNIFLSDLPKNFHNKENDLLKLNENESISSLIWADDLLLFSESQNGLNNMLKSLHEYSLDNLIEVNIEKTKYMIFNKAGRLIRKHFWLGNERIDTTREYKYLGLLITPSFNLKATLSDLKDRARRAIYTMKTKLGPLFRKEILTSLHLFDSLVKPILLYASDFWGCLKLPKDNPIETIHINFCKELLGTQKQTPNIAVLLELGRIPLQIHAKKNCIKYWEKIAQQKNANLLTRKTYEWALNQETGWGHSVKNYLCQIGLMNVFLNIGVNKPANMEVFNREKYIFHQLSFNDIQNNFSKLKTYAKLKTNIGLEKYLVSVKNVTDRISLTKLRLSNHTLMIEKGRHQNIEIENRLCPFCPTCIEDEMHFLIKCPAYIEYRAKLMDTIHYTLRNHCILGSASLFMFLMKSDNITHVTANFITQANKLRNSLID